MTETAPLLTVARPAAGRAGDDEWADRLTAGRLSPWVEARIVGDDGVQPHDGDATGEVEVRGPWVASAYFDDPEGADKFSDGWLRTGDIGTIDPRGFVRLTDRAKDLIKSGGEWISSVELENELAGHPQVREAAVIAMPDERWSERPLACVVLEADADVGPAELRGHLEGSFARWQLPDSFAFVDEVPKTSVGKFDKKVLRRRLADGELEIVTASEVKA
jgi:fatty-acyl-CoA synthase